MPYSTALATLPPPDVRPSRAALWFPSHWKGTGNPQAARIQRETLAWLRNRRLLRSLRDEQEVRRYHCALLGGATFPESHFERNLLVTQLFALWILWHDRELSAGDASNVGPVLEALRGEPAGPGSPIVEAWACLGRRLRGRRSSQWIDKLVGAMKIWCDGVTETNPKDPYDFLRIQALRTGLQTALVLAEHVDDVEWPDALEAVPEIHRLRDAAARITALDGQLFGLPRDLEIDRPNVIPRLSTRLGLTTEAAFHQVVEWRNHEVERFDRIASELSTVSPDVDDAAQRFLRSARQLVHGFALWRSVASRYNVYQHGFPLATPELVYGTAINLSQRKVS